MKTQNIDIPRLKYELDVHGISRADLMSAQGWASTTYNRKMTGQVDWWLREINKLVELGLPIASIHEIFLRTSLQKRNSYYKYEKEVKDGTQRTSSTRQVISSD